MSNKNFKLDPRLEADCIVMGQLNSSLLLLLNNALVPWFILVPFTEITEFHELDRATQVKLLDEINLISSYVKSEFNVQKLNTATIGNIVSQLHIHIIGRHEQDYCWPGVVWGRSEKEPYPAEKIDSIRESLKIHLGNRLNASQ